MSQELEDCVLLLYAKGMSNADIIDFLAQTYKINYSTSQVSIITNQMLEDIKIWQTRPLEDQYAVVWIDAIHYKIRQDGKVISKAAMIVLGIDMEGKQDILSIYIVEKKVGGSYFSKINSSDLHRPSDPKLPEICFLQGSTKNYSSYQINL